MTRIALALLVLAAATPLAAQRAALPADDISPFPAFMSGEWVERSDQRWTEESWADRGVRMLGVSREGAGDTLRSRESMAIEPTAEGLVYIAQPDGAKAVAFPMIRQDALSIEFANPAHDYPQRIRYWRDGDTLYAEIALLDGSQARRWSYLPKSGIAR